MMIIESIIEISTFFHLVFFVIFLKMKKNKLNNYFMLFKGNLLTVNEFFFLFEKYNNFLFGKIEPLPKETEYPNLFTNLEFKRFVNKYKTLAIYLYFSVPFHFILVLILGSDTSGSISW